MVYNKLMNNCNCKSGTNISSQRFNTATNCELLQSGSCHGGTGCGSSSSCGLCTVTIPANKGTDAAGQPYAPQLGAWTNTIVRYAATGAVYIYDSNGIYTAIGKATTPTPPTPGPDPEQPTGPLTASEYDGLALTAIVYDAYRLTATMYDSNAKQYLIK